MLAGKIAEKMSYDKADGGLGRPIFCVFKCKDYIKNDAGRLCLKL